MLASQKIFSEGNSYQKETEPEKCDTEMDRFILEIKQKDQSSFKCQSTIPFQYCSRYLR